MVAEPSRSATSARVLSMASEGLPAVLATVQVTTSPSARTICLLAPAPLGRLVVDPVVALVQDHDCTYSLTSVEPGDAVSAMTKGCAPGNSVTVPVVDVLL